MSKYLQDPEYLFGILTVLVKKNGGKITLTEEELNTVSTGDLIGMYFEPATKSIILKEVDAQDMLRAQSIVNDKVDETYDN
tara:strand:+ start:1888 stop:2130 length:243 start_codon:yes stop_codon:yes gene_type:complete